MTVLTTATEQDTFKLGVSLGQAAQVGLFVGLNGVIGAGKTVFSRGVGRGLAVSSNVQSPTFIIAQSHQGGRLPLIHADLYRLGGVEDLEQLGLDELFEPRGVVLVEWASRFAHILPADRLDLTLECTQEGRRVVLQATGAWHDAWLRSWLAQRG